MKDMRYLATTGLSMSQAQSISNLCHQRAQEIERKLSLVNNSTKTVKIRKETYVQQKGMAMPKDAPELLYEKGKLHACQAFLMEAIKEKERLMRKLSHEPFQYSGEIPQPDMPDYEDPKLEPSVDENWGWDQLTPGEWAEYLEAEAMAAHIGQFIHKDGKLDVLRAELSYPRSLQWVSDGDVKYPVKVEEHHTAEDLHALHEKLALAHREFEQKVNYFKAKVKNLVTEENARIHRANATEEQRVQEINSKLEEEYNVARRAYMSSLKAERETFEAKREESLRDASKLRINVNPRFQTVIDMFMKDLGE